MRAPVSRGLDLETLKFTLEAIGALARRELSGGVDADARAPIRAALGG
ncbi:MAG TPA: hypothetical protein VFY32_13880 [Solirubrobacteraceae bacterium]|nr:hypothetical protein [Solirubrobacteraceae bacterium]